MSPARLRQVFSCALRSQKHNIFYGSKTSEPHGRDIDANYKVLKHKSIKLTNIYIRVPKESDTTANGVTDADNDTVVDTLAGGEGEGVPDDDAAGVSDLHEHINNQVIIDTAGCLSFGPIDKYLCFL